MLGERAGLCRSRQSTACRTKSAHPRLSRPLRFAKIVRRLGDRGDDPCGCHSNLVFAAALTVAALLPAPAATAAEIKLMCPAPMRTTITDLVAQFERATPHKVTIVHTPSRMIVERVQGGEAVRRLDPDGGSDRRPDQAGQGREYASISPAPASGSRFAAGAPAPDVSSADGGEAHAAGREDLRPQRRRRERQAHAFGFRPARHHRADEAPRPGPCRSAPAMSPNWSRAARPSLPRDRCRS